jgi:hypothetical protein
MEQLIVNETIAGILLNIACRISTPHATVPDSGLLTGKLGMAIFLFHYGKCYHNAACTQLADDFIEDIRINRNKITSVDYGNGLSGIDAGLKYLAKNEFIDADLAEMPEMAVQTICNSFLNFPSDNVHEHLYRLSGLGKYFAQDYRKISLTTIGPFSKSNRKCVSQLINLLGLLDVNLIPQLDHKGILCMMDVLSRIYQTGYKEKEIRQFFSYGLQGLEAIICSNTNFKPFINDCNPFCIALSLLKIYERTTNQRFATLAIRILEKYEGAVNELYLVKDIRDDSLLQHAIACKKLHSILYYDCFNKYSGECLEFYRKRKSGNMYTLQNREQCDLSLQSGYAGEGMALLTLDGCVQMDWLEELMY